MTEHTPGPWAIEHRKPYGVGPEMLPSRVMAGDIAVCSFTNHPKSAPMWDGTREANARLIAAAPETAAERDRLREINAELLAALDLLVDAIDEMQIAAATGSLNLVTDKMRAVLPLRTNARAAIAKAEEESA